jgi:hypothetical protein
MRQEADAAGKAPVFPCVDVRLATGNAMQSAVSAGPMQGRRLVHVCAYLLSICVEVSCVRLQALQHCCVDDTRAAVAPCRGRLVAHL